jgi:hypothetical protein
MDLPKLWAQIRTDLMRARDTLPSNTREHEALREYEELLNQNELELAIDMLEFYAEKHLVSSEFWIALRDAAEKMKLSGRARRYEEFSNKRSQR